MQKQLEQLIEQKINEGAFPGCTYAIIFKNKIISGVKGYKQLVPEKKENHVDNLYDLASLTKVVVTTSCILKLLEQNKISLTQKVNEILPDIKHDDLTIYHLITHTSCYPPGVRGVTKMKTKEEVLNAIENTLLTEIPGTKIIYSDINFILLGLIVEKITNKGLDQFAKEVLFDPVEMNNTCFNPVDKSRCVPTEVRNDDLFQGIVQGFVHDETSYLLGGVAGHAGCFSTVKDLANFIQMILNNGIFKEKVVYKKETLNNAFKVYIKSNLEDETDTTGRTIGWQKGGKINSKGSLTSEETIYHTGFTGTNIWIDRENEVGFCMLTNRVHPSRTNTLLFEARKEIADFIMDNLASFK